MTGLGSFVADDAIPIVGLLHQVEVHCIDATQTQGKKCHISSQFGSRSQHLGLGQGAVEELTAGFCTDGNLRRGIRLRYLYLQPRVELDAADTPFVIIELDQSLLENLPDTGGVHFLCPVGFGQILQPMG